MRHHPPAPRCTGHSKVQDAHCLPAAGAADAHGMSVSASVPDAHGMGVASRAFVLKLWLWEPADLVVIVA